MRDMNCGMGRAVFRGVAAVLLGLFCLYPAVEAPATPVKVEDHVLLKSGRVLPGRIVGTEELKVGKAYKVATDFGQLLVPIKATRATVQSKKARDKKAKESDETFSMRRIRVLRFRGTVERKPKGSDTWTAVSWKDKYGKPIVNKPNAIVKPGDTIRTGRRGEIDLVPHHDVWLRIGPKSLVEIPTTDPKPKKGSIQVTKGEVVPKVRGRPRGQVFRVRTPLTLLSVKGTFFRVSVAEKEEGVYVEEGAVSVQGIGEVRGGTRASWKRDSGSGLDVTTSRERYAMPTDIRRFPFRRMVYVPGGSYRDGGADRGASGGQPHSSSFRREFSVVVSSCLIDLDETIRRDMLQYALAMQDGVVDLVTRVSLRDLPEADLDVPVMVKHADAVLYARWCGSLLPSEGQWIAAARGPRALLYPWGNKYTARHRRAFEALPHWSQPRPLGETFDVSPYGARRMSVSVPEWTSNIQSDDPWFSHLQYSARGEINDLSLPVFRGPNAIRSRGGGRAGTSSLGSMAGIRLIVPLGD